METKKKKKWVTGLYPFTPKYWEKRINEHGNIVLFVNKSITG
jgi:hypothetical protein